MVMKQYAEVDPVRHDMRNQQSYNVCREIVDKVELYLPII
jgi:hypothetical protein